MEAEKLEQLHATLSKLTSGKKGLGYSGKRKNTWKSLDNDNEENGESSLENGCSEVPLPNNGLVDI